MDEQRRWRYAGRAALAAGLSAQAYSAFVAKAGALDTMMAMFLAFMVTFVLVATFLRRK